MIVDPAVIPGLLILAAELAALAAVGYVVVRVALRQSDDRVALAQGLVVGPALWGLITNFVLYAVPGLAGAAVGWGVTLALGAVLARRSPQPLRPRLGTAVGFAGAFLVLLWLALASRQLLEMPDPTLHLGLAAWLRAGGFPPEVPWNPGHLLHYHHGVGPAGRAADAAGRTRPGIRARAARRLRLDGLRAGGGDGAAGARVVEGRAGHRAARCSPRAPGPGRAWAAAFCSLPFLPGCRQPTLVRRWQVSTGRRWGRRGLLRRRRCTTSGRRPSPWDTP